MSYELGAGVGVGVGELEASATGSLWVVGSGRERGGGNLKKAGWGRFRGIFRVGLAFTKMSTNFVGKWDRFTADIVIAGKFGRLPDGQDG